MPDPKRETKRERREVAKQRRMEELRRRQRKEAMKKFWYAGISLVVIGGIVAAILLLGGGPDTKKFNELAASAGCDNLQSPSDEGQGHVASPRRVTYRTNPPTSGQHYSSTSFTGILPNPLPAQLQDENLVHNMEHGHVLIWYKPSLDTALLDQLKTFVRGNATRRILIPRENMDFQIAFTAWAHSVGCKNPNEKVVDVGEMFADFYQGNGPEGTGDAPGTPTGV